MGRARCGEVNLSLSRSLLFGREVCISSTWVSSFSLIFLNSRIEAMLFVIICCIIPRAKHAQIPKVY